MRLIAHRGLTWGPGKENDPDTIKVALEERFDVEVDAHYIPGQGWWLGHDGPQHKVEVELLETPGVWVHCKNLEALNRASERMHYFWHEGDAYAQTSRGIWWTTQALPTRDAVLMDASLKKPPDFTPYGICSDYVALLREAK